MGPHARGGAPRLEVTRRWVTEIACPGFTSTRSAARTSSACLRSLARPDVGARRAAPRGDSEMSLRILLADDHVIVRQGVKNLLVGEGYKVVGEATDGREAVRLAQVLHSLRFQDIALHPRAERFGDVRPLLLHRQQDGFGPAGYFQDLPRRVYAVQERHGEIQQGNVRTQIAG